MAALLLDIGPGDEVIVPSFTFVSTANAFVAARRAAGLRRHPARHAQPRRAPARGARHAADAGDRPGPLRRRRLRDGRDPARSPRRAGSRSSRTTRTASSGRTADSRSARWGALATLTFHETKNFSCGEGGALLINDERLSSSGPRSSARRAPTGSASSAARSTSTPGSTSARATCRRTCSRPTSTASSSRRSQCSRPAAGSGSATSGASRPGRRETGVRLPTIPPDCAVELPHVLPDPADARRADAA